jgi:hypothetical protein
VAPIPDPPFADGAEALQAHLDHSYGSHERPRVVYEWVEAGQVDAFTAAHLVRDAWVWRNEKMPGNLHNEDWEFLFGETAGDPGTWFGDLAFPTTVYRGGHPDGMSWTTDRAIAERFAEVPGRDVHALELLDYGEVLAVFDDRNEAEVVLRPGAWARAQREAS